MGQRELELRVDQLLNVGTTNLSSADLADLDDVDGAETSTVLGSHILVAGSDGISTGELTVLLVHVMGARARVIANPNTKVLHLHGLLLEDLVAAHDLTSGLLDLLDLLEEVEETGLGNDLVGRKNAHLVQLLLRGGLSGNGELTADDLVLVHHPR